MTDAELRAVEEVIARLREGVPLHDVAPGLDPSLVELAALLAGELTEAGWGGAAAVPAGFDAVWESVAVLGGVGASGAAAVGGGMAAGGGGAAAGAAGGGAAGGAAAGGAAAGTAGAGGAGGILGGIAGVVGGLGATTTVLVTTAVVAGAVIASVVLGGEGADPESGPPNAVIEPADPDVSDVPDPDLGDSLWSAPPFGETPGVGPQDPPGPPIGADALAPPDTIPTDPAAPTEVDPPSDPAAPVTPEPPTSSVDPEPPGDAGQPQPPVDPGPPSSPAPPVDPPSEPPVDPGPPAPPGPPDPPGPPGPPDPPGPPGPPDRPGDPDPDPDPDPEPPLPPVATGATVTIESGDEHVFDIFGDAGGEPFVTAGGAELDHDSLAVVEGSGPTHATVRVEAGTLVYRPDPFWLGRDSFRFRVCDATGDDAGCAEAVLEVTTGRKVEHITQDLPGQPTFTFSFAPHRDPATAAFPDISYCPAGGATEHCLVTQESADSWRWFGPPGQVPGGYPFVLVIHVNSWATEDGVDGPTGVSYELRVTLTHPSSGGVARALEPAVFL